MTILASSSIYSTNPSRFELGLLTAPVSCFRAFFGSTAPQAFFRPDRRFYPPPCAGAVKAGRRSAITELSGLFRPRLEGPEHGGNIARLGQVAVPSTKKLNPPLR